MRALAFLFALAALARAQEYGTEYRLKIDVSGDSRKGVLFVPKDPKKGEVFPLLVALPDTQGKAYLEMGQWQQPAAEHRFAVFSVDISTSGQEGWHPKEQLAMQRDMEAVTEGIKVALQTAQENGIAIDDSATVLTAFSGGTYLALWLGVRRPDLFFGLCGRCCVFWKETVEFGKFDKHEPNKAMPILLYHGELDHPRVKKETELAKKCFDEAGFTNVTLKVVPKMAHESKPEVFLEWYLKLLKDTEKARKETHKIREDLDKLRPDVEAAKTGAYSKLLKLVEREQKTGMAAGAQALLTQVENAAKKDWEQAENLEADYQLLEAAEGFKEIEKKYRPLPIANEARTRRVKILHSDAYKAEELLQKGREYLDKGNREKAMATFGQVVDKYPDTPAAEQAKALMGG